MYRLLLEIATAARLLLELRVLRARYELERDLDADADRDEALVVELRDSPYSSDRARADRLLSRRIARSGVGADIRARLAALQRRLDDSDGGRSVHADARRDMAQPCQDVRDSGRRDGRPASA